MDFVASGRNYTNRRDTAISHSLARLRKQLGDPLLVRVGGRMQPSPKARSLYAEIKPILQKFERVVQPDVDFDPASSARTFRIGGPTLVSVSTEIIARMQAVAPDTGLELMPAGPQNIQQILDQELDMAWGNANFPVPDGIRAETIGRFKRYVIGRREHPAANDWSQDAWVQWPHVVVRIPGAIHNTVGDHFARPGLEAGSACTSRPGPELARPWRAPTCCQITSPGYW